MNCPRCGHKMYVEASHKTPLDRDTMHAGCPVCRWESPAIVQLVEASPAYRLAKLKAEKAEPGWYGPDGYAADVVVSELNGLTYLHWRAAVIPLALARLCGFVEVRYE